VAWRFNKALGNGKFWNGMDGGRWSHASLWPDNVGKVEGFEPIGSDKEPRAGDAAQWNVIGFPCKHPITGETIDCGHVAYVDEVKSDGSIVISEYNRTECGYSQRTLKRGSDWPNNFIRPNLTPGETVDYAKIDDGAAVTERTQLTENVDLTPSGNIFVKVWNWVKGVAIHLFNPQSSGEKTVNAESPSSATFLFSNVVTEVIAYLADFGGNTTFAAYNNDQVLKTVNITSSTPEYYTISNVGAITKVVVNSTSGWVGPVTTTTEFYVNAMGSCGEKKPCYTTIQAALNAVGDRAVIKVAQGRYPEVPIRSTTGTVTISGGWKTDFSGQTGTTEMYAPKATGGGGVKLIPNIKVVAP